MSAHPPLVIRDVTAAPAPEAPATAVAELEPSAPPIEEGPGAFTPYAKPKPVETVPDPGRLSELERVIEKGLKTFIEVGTALSEIRESRLYLQTHETFEDYCRDRWQLTINYADRLMLAGRTVENLKATVPIGTPMPTHESQARPLTKLEPEQQPAAWIEATKDNPRPTAKQVEDSVEKVIEADSTQPVHSWDKPTVVPEQDELPVGLAEEEEADVEKRTERFIKKLLAEFPANDPLDVIDSVLSALHTIRGNPRPIGRLAENQEERLRLFRQGANNSYDRAINPMLALIAKEGQQTLSQLGFAADQGWGIPQTRAIAVFGSWYNFVQTLLDHLTEGGFLIQRGLHGGHWDLGPNFKMDSPMVVIRHHYPKRNPDVIAMVRSVSHMCCICSKTLTDPLSMELGIGPECRRKREALL